MPIDFRRLFRSAKADQPPATTPPSDPRPGRALKRLIAAERARVLPTDEELDTLSEVAPADIDAAERLWNLAQERAGTGLEGLLSATTGEDAGDA